MRLYSLKLTVFILEQFTVTVKAHPASFEGEGGTEKIEEHFSQLTQHCWASIIISKTSQLTKQYYFNAKIMLNIVQENIPEQFTVKAHPTLFEGEVIRRGKRN